MSDKHVVIVGGGLVGAFYAVLLAKRNFRVSVYEKRDDLRKALPVRGRRTTNLTLSCRGMQALKYVGLAEEIAPYQVPMYARMVHAVNGSLHPLYYGRKYQFILSTQRNKLNENLLNAAEKLPNVMCHFKHNLKHCNLETGALEFSQFLSIVNKWPGSTHDAFIWANSSIARKFERGEVDGWLLGDSGYPLRLWLLTPINHPKSRPEERFNSAHRRSRVVVEKAFGVLKSRFRCLHKTGGALDYKPVKCCKIIYVCCLLHNICVEKHLPLLKEIDNEYQIVDEEVTYQGPLNDGKNTRDQIIQ